VGGGVEVGIADKKWGQTAHVHGPRTSKSGGQMSPGPRGSAAPEETIAWFVTFNWFLTS